MRLIASFVILLATAFAQVATAQDPPTRVGRVAFTEGSVALFQDPEEGWEKAYVNSPVTSENSIWTDPSARAEMRVSGVAIRVDESTQLDVVKLDEDELEAFVPQGSVGVRVRHFANGDRLDFATPHARFRLYGTGRYRIDVDPDRDETTFTVFAGTASMRSASGDVRVDAGRAIRVEGGANPSFFRMRAEVNAFDRWTLARDERWTESRSVQYVSTDMTGYEDLDRYGTWAQEPEYGAIWYPTRVSRDWVPYRQGHWDYVRPWGWTWIAEEPWGYAPYHYGRWVYVRDRWGWYPGPRASRPAWAPALVAWVGGSNFSVGISGGASPALGWYPLAPWERYEPWYRTNTAYVNRINVVVSDRGPRQWEGRDRGDWRYLNRDRGATVIRRDAFVSRQPVERNAVRVTQETIRQAQVAPPANVLPGPEQFRRAARPAAQPPEQRIVRPGAPTGAPSAAPSAAPATQAQGPAEIRRPGERGGPSARPDFERRQATPAPAPAPATAQQPAPQQPAAAAPPARPFGRDDQRTQERAAREAQQQQQQAQERAAREAQQAQQQQQQQQQQQAQERAAREAQQAQERAAREAQRGQQQQQQQQQQAQERAAREAQQAQERAAREAQQAQERAARDQQQQIQDRARAQERAAQEQQQRQQQQQQQQQAQERAARDAQQAQERAAREAQQAQERAAREAQQAQERAAREAQRAQQQQRGQPAAQQPPPGREAAPAQAPSPPPAQPTAPPRGEPARGEQARGRDKEKDKDKDKDDDDKPGKGRGR